MKKAILCCSPIGTSLIRSAKLADYSPKIFSDFIFTPMPREGDGFDFYEKRILLVKANHLSGYGYYSSRRYLDYFQSIFDHLKGYERIELWIEPSLNSHIHSFHLLILLSKIPDIQNKLFINHTSDSIGLMNNEMLMVASLEATLVTPNYFKEATLYWEAFCSPNPKKWLALLDTSILCYPLFKAIHKRFLLQLPIEPTGLRLVDRQILKHVRLGRDSYGHVLGHVLTDQMDDIHILSEKAIWDAIYSLASAPRPALVGLVLEPFKFYSSSKSTDLKRKKAFMSKPKLTAFGEALLEGDGNWIDENDVDYWWGGTHITNDNYWSFDAQEERLIGP